jgi:hypothetical protein
VAESISDRKRSHLELCEGEAVEFKGKTTLLEEVDLLHDALPELAVDEVAIDTELLGCRPPPSRRRRSSDSFERSGPMRSACISTPRRS